MHHFLPLSSASPPPHTEEKAEDSILQDYALELSLFYPKVSGLLGKQPFVGEGSEHFLYESAAFEFC